MKKIIVASVVFLLIGVGAYLLQIGERSTGIDQRLIDQIREVWPT